MQLMVKYSSDNNDKRHALGHYFLLWLAQSTGLTSSARGHRVRTTRSSGGARCRSHDATSPRGASSSGSQCPCPHAALRPPHALHVSASASLYAYTRGFCSQQLRQYHLDPGSRGRPPTAAAVRKTVLLGAAAAAAAAAVPPPPPPVPAAAPPPPPSPAVPAATLAPLLVSTSPVVSLSAFSSRLPSGSQMT